MHVSSYDAKLDYELAGILVASEKTSFPEKKESKERYISSMIRVFAQLSVNPFYPRPIEQQDIQFLQTELEDIKSSRYYKTLFEQYRGLEQLINTPLEFDKRNFWEARVVERVRKILELDQTIEPSIRFMDHLHPIIYKIYSIVEYCLNPYRDERTKTLSAITGKLNEIDDDLNSHASPQGGGPSDKRVDTLLLMYEETCAMVGITRKQIFAHDEFLDITAKFRQIEEESTTDDVLKRRVEDLVVTVGLYLRQHDYQKDVVLRYRETLLGLHRKKGFSTFKL